MSAIEVAATFAPTPEQLAASFWEMGSDEQAKFFAHLNRIAGVKLCFQMEGVVQEIVALADKGERDAMDGFQTMLAHAQDYHESASSWRAINARIELGRMTSIALNRVLGGAA